MDVGWKFYLPAVVPQSVEIVTHFTEDFDLMTPVVRNEYMSPGCHRSALWILTASRHVHDAASFVSELDFVVMPVTYHVTCFGLDDGRQPHLPTRDVGLYCVQRLITIGWQQGELRLTMMANYELSLATLTDVGCFQRHVLRCGLLYLKVRRQRHKVDFMCEINNSQFALFSVHRHHAT